MPECEFKEWCEILTGQTSFCTEEEYEKMGKDYCEDIERFRQFFNSPQFKKQYAKLSDVEKEIEKFRESLLKEYEKMTGVLNVEFHASLDEAYQKHGAGAMYSYVVARSHKLIRTHTERRIE